MVGEGPFTECVVLPGQLTNKCANCYYSRSNCDSAKGRCRKIVRWTLLIVPSGRVRPSRQYNLPSKQAFLDTSVNEAEDGTSFPSSQKATDPFSTPAEKRKNQESNEPKEALSIEASFPPLKRPRYQQVDNKLSLSMTISRTLKSVKEYHIFGDFALPHPSNLETPEALRDLALDWEQAFKNFNDRDFLTIQKPIIDLNQAFKEFQTLEVRTWTDICRQPGASEYFVQPSGMLDSLLAHHLHQPSMTTTKLKDGATADSSMAASGW